MGGSPETVCGYCVNYHENITTNIDIFKNVYINIFQERNILNNNSKVYNVRSNSV